MKFTHKARVWLQNRLKNSIFSLDYLCPPRFLSSCRPHKLHLNKKPQSNLGRAASPPLMAKDNCARKSPMVTMGCPTFAPKLPLPCDGLHSHLIHPSLDGPHSPLQTASRSNQPFCRSTPFGQTSDRPTDRLRDKRTDRQTDRRDWRQVCTNTRWRSIILFTFIHQYYMVDIINKLNINELK